jgi:hypothetical protein
MSRTYFSKLDPKEKESRLLQLANSQGKITVWVKGQQEKYLLNALDFQRHTFGLVIDNQEEIFVKGAAVLCSFELRGMSFFSQVIVNKSIASHMMLEFNDFLYKSEKRASYRLLTHPIYEVRAEFNAGEGYQGEKVIDIKTRTSQTGLFKNFLKLLSDNEDEAQPLRFRVQDLSVTGMSIHIGEIDKCHFVKDLVFHDVVIVFKDERITVPKVKVIYIVDFIANEKIPKRYKVGLHFSDLPAQVDDQLGKKINQLLRQIDFNKDFENFTK